MVGTAEQRMWLGGALIILFVIPFIFAALPPDPPTTPGLNPGGGGSQGLELLEPEDKHFTKESSVKFRFLANDTDIEECDLMLNGTSAKSFTTGFTGVLQTTQTGLDDGEYSWYVLCSKSGGTEIESDIYKLYVDTETPEVVLSTASPSVGEFLEYNGSHWYPGDLYVNLSNGSVIGHDSVAVEDDGTWSDKMYMKYTYETGSYDLIFYQEGAFNHSEIETLTLSGPSILVSTDQSAYYAGDTVTITGQGFDASGQVDVEVTLPDASTWSLRQRILSDGSFEMPYVLSAAHDTGTYSITATSVAYADIFGTATFIVADAGETGGDLDGDGILDDVDNCKSVANPGQQDNDSDGLGNACDTTPDGVTTTPTEKDYDEDGVPDATDNCKVDPNPNQMDSDSDGKGDACDSTPNGDVKNNVPTCTDGIMNQGEYGIDCGGPCKACEDQKAGSSGGMLLWIIIIVIVVVILVGTIGFLAYEGKIDLSSLTGTSKNLMSPESIGAGTSAGSSGANDENLKHFIFSERSHGYDDLTIRNALIQKGWPETDVDRVFQAVYTD